MRMTAAIAIAAALWFGQAAQAAEPMQELIGLYRLTISNELCDFPLTSAQSDELTRRAEDLESKLTLTDDASTKLYEQIEAQMTKQVEAGLCKAGGEWAREYARQVVALGVAK